MSKFPLWLWIGLRMSALAISAVLVITSGMSLYYWVADYRVELSMTAADRQDFAAALTDIYANEDVLWGLIKRYYDISDHLPGFSDNADWWALFTLVTGVMPIILIVGFMLSRPISAQFSKFAVAARQVARGNLSVRVKKHKQQPAEIQGFCDDFNQMVEKLAVYERDVKESSSNLAHELRTPLNAALGRIQGMIDDIFPLSTEQLALVKGQLLNLNSLVEDLHFLSLAHAGQLKIQTSLVSVDCLIEERLSWFAPQLDKANIKILTSLSAQTSITCDPGRIGQLINILIENIVKYAAEGKELTVVSRYVSDKLHLEFADRGQGVVEQDLDHMFVRFWRAEQSRARVSGGGGLGLSIAEVICEAHGGKITAHRRREGGLSIKIVLPASPPADNCYGV